MEFGKLDIKLINAIKDSGYTKPTEVQAKSIPLVQAGKDAVVLAQTGTGKTAAYLLPFLDKLARSQNGERKRAKATPKALILLPTRELAQQVHDACRTYGKYVDTLKVALITGGVPFFRHKKKLNARLDILIATPGRLLDYANREKVNLENVEYLVLDEADRMLDMGFSVDVLKILEFLPQKRQNLLFSATMNSKVKKLYGRFMSSPETIETKKLKEGNSRISQRVQYVSDQSEKSKALDKILSSKEIEQSIIFTSTKSSAKRLAARLVKKGYQADALHGDIRQRVRTKIISKFKDKKLKFLVGTDILGRGIDVPGVSHVINYDMPRDPEDYVHRIGRTGRAEAVGEAITLSYAKESVQHEKIENYLGCQIDQLGLDGFMVFDKSKKSNSRKTNARRSRSRRGSRARNTRRKTHNGKRSRYSSRNARA